MPRKSAGDRMNRYQAKFDPERVKNDLDKLRPEMLNKQSTTSTELEDMETRVRAVLNDSPVYTIDYPAYYDFGRIVNRLAARFNGGYGLTREVEIQRDVWVARGKDRTTLTRIAYEAFGITLS